MKTAKKPKKPKKPSIGKIKKECVHLATLIAKRRDGNCCTVCGKMVGGSDAHGSHIIPQSGDGRLAMHPFNILQMCMHCHLYWWHKDPIGAMVWLKSKHLQLAKWLHDDRLQNRRLGTINRIWLEDWKSKLELWYAVPGSVDAVYAAQIESNDHSWTNS